VFERLTSEARDVVCGAHVHARRLGHAWVGCEHLLLGLAGADGPAGAVLRDRGARPEAVEEAITALIGRGPADSDEKIALASLGIDLDQVRTATEAAFGPGALDVGLGNRCRRRRRRLRRQAAPGPATRGLPFTPRAKRCLELSLRESVRLKHRSIGLEHVALALVVHDDTAAWSVLTRLGVDPAEVRSALEGTLRRSA